MEPISFPFFAQFDEEVICLIFNDQLMGFHPGDRIVQHFPEPALKFICQLVDKYPIFADFLPNIILNFFQNNFSKYVKPSHHFNFEPSSLDILTGRKRPDPHPLVTEEFVRDLETELMSEACPTCGSYFGLGFSINTANSEFVTLENINFNYIPVIGEPPEVFDLQVTIDPTLLFHALMNSLYQRRFIGQYVIDLNRRNRIKIKIEDVEDLLDFWMIYLRDSLIQEKLSPVDLFRWGYSMVLYWFCDLPIIEEFIYTLIERVLEGQLSVSETGVALSIITRFDYHLTFEFPNEAQYRIFQKLVEHKEELENIAQSYFRQMPGNAAEDSAYILKSNPKLFHLENFFWDT